MKIIENNHDKENNIWEGQCIKCDSGIECNTNELTNIVAGDYRNDYDDFSWEKCPVCKNQSSVCFHKKGS